jgi:PST family polysaccharide transporter
MSTLQKLQENITVKRLGENFLSLLMLQFINYVLPLFLIPYLIRHIGMEGFGIYSFIFAIIAYGQKVSDYGFDLSATYHISLHQKEPHKINEIFSSVLAIKSLLATLFLIILTLITFSVEKLYAYQDLLFLSYGMVIGHLLLPLWFFQGIEKMRYIMYLNGFLKLSFFILVILFIKTPDDLSLLLLIHSIMAIVVGISGLYIAIRDFNIQLKAINRASLLFHLKDSWYIFTSKIAVELYSTSSTILVGFFATPLIIGYYAVTVKIMAALGNLFDPITRTVYPYLVGVYQSSNENFITRNRQLSLVILLIMIPISLLLFFFAKEILEIVTGKEPATLNIYLLQVSSLMLIVFPYGSQFTNMLVTIKETKKLNQILFVAAGLNLLLAPPLLYFYGVVGMIWLNAFLAYYLTLTKAYYIHRYTQSKREERS